MTPESRIKAHLSRYDCIEKSTSVPSFADCKQFVESRRQGNVTTETFVYSVAEFREFFESSGYLNYDLYRKMYGAEPQKLKAKAIEHFLCFKNTIDGIEGGQFVDVAADKSPSSEIFMSRSKNRVFRHDITYKPGIHNLTIGSSAENIPVTDEFFDGIYSNSSWEHFEGSIDLLFLLEASRILKRRAKLYIITLFLKKEAESHTSPSVWHNKYAHWVGFPNFDPRSKVLVREQIKQRLVKFHSLETLSDDLALVNGMEFVIQHSVPDLKTDSDGTALPSFISLVGRKN